MLKFLVWASKLLQFLEEKYMILYRGGTCTCSLDVTGYIGELYLQTFHLELKKKQHSFGRTCVIFFSWRGKDDDVSPLL